MSYQSTYLEIDLQAYDYLFAMDWSLLSDSEIAFKRRDRSKIIQKKINSEIKSLIDYFNQFKGKKIIVFEETCGAHWLYINLKESFDRVIICDPYRNSLLKEGSKSDKIDAFKLLHLLLNKSLKEVYHSDSELYNLRSFMSAYHDLNKYIVRLKNQILAFKRSRGLKKKDKHFRLEHSLDDFVLSNQKLLLEKLESMKEGYLQEMKKLIRKHPKARNLLSISGIGIIIALTIYAIIIDAYRFPNKNKLYGYSGLAKLLKESGKTIRWKRHGKHNKLLKWAFKSAALAAIRGHNDIHDYYMFLLGKGYTEYNARHEVARYICRVCYAMLKSGSPYKPYSWRH